jgi:hypothetical protein
MCLMRASRGRNHRIESTLSNRILGLATLAVCFVGKSTDDRVGMEPELPSMQWWLASSQKKMSKTGDIDGADGDYEWKSIHAADRLSTRKREVSLGWLSLFPPPQYAKASDPKSHHSVHSALEDFTFDETART